MRFDGRKVRLNLLEGRQSGYDLGYCFHRSGAVFCNSVRVIVVRGLSAGYIDVYKGAQAIVLAEVTARVFVARRAIADVRDGVETDKRGLASVAPNTVRLLGAPLAPD
jgi:hypothetical protein